MIAAAEERVLWHPETAAQQEAVCAALAAVLASPHFCNSKRYPALLEYVVDALLAGRAAELKERTLGIEVFGRRPDYDTNSDTVVRYTAGEVRKRLALYYSELAQPPAIRIHLPVGSYVPELLLLRETGPEVFDRNLRAPELEASAPSATSFAEPLAPHHAPEPAPDRPADVPEISHTLPPARRRRVRPVLWLLAASVLLVLAGLAVRVRTMPLAGGADRVLNLFWGPTLSAPGTKLICSGSVVFNPNSYSGVVTAPKSADYSFFSVQIAESIAHLSGFLERRGATYTVQTSASTSLTELRDRSVILVGGYNNLWSMRLLEPLRFHFSPDLSSPAIVDAKRPGQVWARDSAQGYGSADDYAIVARFRDSLTGSPIVVLAGLGRNGTEAATQFVTNPDFLTRYTSQHQLPPKGNIEFILRSRVIEGKTGEPAVIAVATW